MLAAHLAWRVYHERLPTTVPSHSPRTPADSERRVVRSGVSAGELLVLDPASDLADSVEVVAEER